MSAPAAISASLVNMRNVGTHKSVALTIHVPEELAAQVIDAFGWPTMANPVSVAIARLRDAETDSRTNPSGTPEAARGGRSSVTPENSIRGWPDLKPSQQAGIRCSDNEFREFLYIKHGLRNLDEDSAADCIRRICGVSSRRELNEDQRKRVLWHQLDREFLEHVGKLPHG